MAWLRCGTAIGAPLFEFHLQYSTASTIALTRRGSIEAIYRRSDGARLEPLLGRIEMSYTLITANRNYSSWSLRPWLLMTMLDIPFKERIEPFAASDNYGAFRSFSPTGQVPVLRDGDRTIWDSLGIALYLADRHQGTRTAAAAYR